MATNTEQDDDILLCAPTFAMWLWGGRADGVTAHGTNLFECPIGFIEPMLALDDQRVIVRQVSMQHDLLVGGKFEQHIDDVILFINVEDKVDQMLEIAQGVPKNIVIIKGVWGHDLGLLAGLKKSPTPRV